jgi:hypothetical protein
MTIEMAKDGKMSDKPNPDPVGVVRAPAQILKWQPVVGAVYNGASTSAVVFRGNESAFGGEVLVTPEMDSTDAAGAQSLGNDGWTCLTVA